MNAILHLDQVTRIHGSGPTEVHALRGVSFRAHAGELVAVMGPSGSGKSTLLTLAGGLDTPTAGRVLVDDVDLAALGGTERARMRRTSIGYVFQDFNLIPALTAVENVALPRELDGVSSRAARALARDLDFDRHVARARVGREPGCQHMAVGHHTPGRGSDRAAERDPLARFRPAFEHVHRYDALRDRLEYRVARARRAGLRQCAPIACEEQDDRSRGRTVEVRQPHQQQPEQ